MQNKRVKFNELLTKRNSLFEKVYHRNNDAFFNGIGRMSKDDIRVAMSLLNIKNLPGDYVWMLEEYGILNIGGYDILGHYDDTDNFLEYTLTARNATNEDYFGYKLRKDYIVLEHDESSALDSDIVLNVITGNVYWWRYDVDKYINYDDPFNELSFIEFLIGCVQNDIESYMSLLS